MALRLSRNALAALVSAGAALFALPLHAAEAIGLSAEAPSPPPAPVVLTIDAPEADQGVASDGTYVYAIDNDRIGKYEIASGRKVGEWAGEPALFPHMNSCTVAEGELVCAASNYPRVPQTSAIEFFSLDPVEHIRTVSLGFMPGSLTVLDRHDGAWWAVFANYDGKGGVPGRGHQYTLLAKLDDQFRIAQSWAFPPEVLARMAPYSCSGMSWGDDGLLYASGHDRPEVYALALPEAGSTLRLVAVHGTANDGQAIDWDPKVPRRLWSVSREGGKVIASTITP
ncbi:hypothetical protein [Altererythrobacter fulvus]|uniref:hypothetical protein n=1 Tax=Caenibius fulvus TaxID=2126012 RepID=UPI0030199A8B